MPGTLYIDHSARVPLPLFAAAHTEGLTMYRRFEWSSCLTRSAIRRDVADMPRHATKAMKSFREVERYIVRVKYHRDSKYPSRSMDSRRVLQLPATVCRQCFRCSNRVEMSRCEGCATRICRSYSRGHFHQPSHADLAASTDPKLS